MYKYEAVCSFTMAEMWKSTQRNIYTQYSKIKTEFNGKKNIYISKNVFLCHNKEFKVGNFN